MERLKKLEIEKLNKGVDSDVRSAGIDKINSFGDFSLIDSVALGDVLKYDQVLGLEYYVILNKLSLEVEKNKFEKRYRKILNDKRNGYK